MMAVYKATLTRMVLLLFALGVAVAATAANAAPNTVSISPNNGPLTGGTAVTLTGTGYLGSTGVTIGGVAATNVVVVSDTQITATTPAGTVGTKAVRVQNPSGASNAPFLFTYNSPPGAPTLTSITPNSGSTLGGTTIVITGTGFTGATAVTVGGNPATSVTINSDTQITAVTPAGTAGLKAVAVTTPAGTGQGGGGFSYVTPPGAPTLTSITPNNGSTLGGTTIVIAGTGFTGATSVTVGGNAATGVTVDSDSQITAVTPAGTAGIKTVAVTTAAGTGQGGGGFTYVAPAGGPEVVSVSPNSGPTTGGTNVTITGTGFTGATDVQFGAVASPSFTVVNDTTITAVTPPRAAGPRSVRVVTPLGESSVDNLFTFTAPVGPPNTTSISPNNGPITGGTAVTLTGTGYLDSTGVTIGGVAATDVVVVSDTQITATTPAGTVGTKAVRVQNPSGASNAPLLFTYNSPPGTPTLSSITPNSGSTLGGTTIVIAGTGFTGATAVTVGGNAATDVTVDSDTQITAITPPGTAGLKAVAVTTAAGTGQGGGGFTYVAPVGAPTLASITPNSGSTLGGTTIVITGTGFTGATDVTIGGNPATGVTVGSDTQITAVTPAGTAGLKAVTVTTAAGTGQGGGGFTYITPVGAPTLSSITPNSGTTLGGTTIVIVGSGFTGATAVTVGGNAATGVTVDSDTQITAVTPAGTAGVKVVAVTTAAGTGQGGGGFTYVAPANGPEIISVSPNSGPSTGGTNVTITGTGFTGATEVQFGAVASPSFVVVNDTTITAVTPPRAAGPRSVRVITPLGESSVDNLFTFTAPAGVPNTTSISPNNGPLSGGTSVTLTGTGYLGSTGVTIGGVAATNVVVVSDTQITATTPAGTVGTKAVRVQNPSGASNAPLLFTYNSPPGAPTLTGIAPNSGSTLGGTTIVITGTGFTGATAVTVGGNAATAVVVNSDTQLTAVTPAGTAGLKAVAVTSAAGTGQGGGGFTYVTPAGAPTLTSITPNSGSTLGGTTIVIAGTGFTGTTNVTVGGNAATGVTVDSDTQITAVTPAGTAGVKVVAVTTAAGTGQGGGGFTYIAPANGPEVISVSPNTGPSTGGTNVTITGTGFTGATEVQFGAVASPSFTVVNDTTITAITPPRAAGPRSVRVITPLGESSVDNLFTFTAPAGAPNTTSVSPNNGPITGGTAVTLTGTGYLGSTGVTIGGVAATNVVVVSDTQITAITPAGTVGAKAVRVQNPSGASNAPLLFTYNSPPGAPTLASITPNRGPTTGGTAIVIAGTGFTGATSVTVGGNAASGVTIDSDTQITAVTPAGTAGLKAVAVTTPMGTGQGGGGFTYVTPAGAPTLTSITPNSGTTLGGTTIVIAGTGFMGATGVTIGGVAATGVTVDSDTQITAITPAGSAGVKTVAVTTPLGSGQGGGGFTYVAPVVQTGTVTLNFSVPENQDISIASATPALSRAIVLTNGQGSTGAITLPEGTYQVTLSGSSGLAFASDDCAESISFNSASRVATITLAANAALTCTFTARDVRGEAREAIGAFIETRARMIMVNEPALSRRIARIEGGSSPKRTVSAYGLPLAMAAPVALTIDQNRAVFATSAGLGTTHSSQDAKSDQKPVSIWAEGSYLDASNQLGDGDFKIIHLGADYLASSNTLVGLGLQLDWAKFADSDSRVEGHGFMVGPYVTHKFGKGIYLDVRAAWGTTTNDLVLANRNLQKFDSSRTLVTAGLSGSFATSGFILRPEVRLSWYDESSGKFTTPDGIYIQPVRFSTGQVQMGPELRYSMTLGDGGRLTPFARVNAIYLFARKNDGLATATTANKLGDDFRMRVSGGADYILASGAAFGADIFYDGIADGAYRSFGGKISVQFGF